MYKKVFITEQNLELSLHNHSNLQSDYLDNHAKILSCFDSDVTVMIVFCNIIYNKKINNSKHVQQQQHRIEEVDQVTDDINNDNDDNLIVRKSIRQAKKRRSHRRNRSKSTR